MTDIQRYANNLGVTETVNGTWIQAIANHFEVTQTTNGTWIQAIAEANGATETVNGTWIQALANTLGIYTTDSTWIKSIADATPLTNLTLTFDVNKDGLYLVSDIYSAFGISFNYNVQLYIEVYNEDLQERFIYEPTITFTSNQTTANNLILMNPGENIIEVAYISNINPNPVGNYLISI